MSSVTGVSAANTASNAAAIVANSAGAASKSAGSTELGREAFLQLLVAQLRYQDPSKPADASSLISQSSQLAVVDKLNAISTAMDRSATATRVDLASNLIGRQVSFAGSDGVVKNASVTSVRFDGTNTYVVAGADTVALENVLSVTSPTIPTTPSTPSTPSSQTPQSTDPAA